MCGAANQRLTAIAISGVVDTVIIHITANERVLSWRERGADIALTSDPMSALRGEEECAKLVWCD